MELDHLAVTCGTLDAGVAAVEAALGVTLAPGGRHDHMGTHNRLLSLGPGLYLEVIAPDPAAPKPAWPRWFDLEARSGPPRLTHWICRADDLAAALAAAPRGAGRATDLARGPFRWRMAVPDTGRLPFDDTFPALIEWQAGGHPSERLPDAGCRLRRLVVTHPRAAEIAAALALNDPRVAFVAGPHKALAAEIDTPHGPRRLE
ncbi:MAG: VOC family protein [Rhodobacteraceae bacterium]|nr:VOC family protein [Paracoccaceae bacterium]